MEDDGGDPGTGLFQRIGQLMSPNRFGGDAPGFGRASTWVGMVSMITGGIIGLSTYRMDVDKRVDESVAKTFDMIRDYNSADLAESRTRVLSYVYARRECDSRIFSRELSDEDFVRVLEFYDLVSACVDVRLCDGPTARNFFSPHANFQWPVLTKVVDDMKNKSASLNSGANFGRGMKALATAPVDAAPCDGNF